MSDGVSCQNKAQKENGLMKATIIEIKRFAVHDGDGIRTTVFLKGCPLKCVWCHNPESIDFSPQLSFYRNKCVSCGMCISVCPVKAHTIADGVHHFNRSICTACGNCETACLNGALKLQGKEISVEEIVPILLQDKDFYDNSGGGITLSGGECLMHADFCRELLREMKWHGIHTAVDTCGFVSKEALDKVIPYTDIFLYDLKAYDEEVHMQCTGQSNVRILDNIRYLDDCGAKIEVRIPFVPDKNADQIDKMARFLAALKNITVVRILPYHDSAGSKYESLGMCNTLPEKIPSIEALEEARACIRAHGLGVV